MHHTTQTNPISVRIGVLTAAAAVSILAIGFAPIPQVFYWLAAGAAASIMTILTGPKGSNSALTLPIAGLLVVPALCTVAVRDTSLIWAVAPILAFVVGAVTWMLATNRYATIEATEETAEDTQPPAQTTFTSGAVTVSRQLDAKRDAKAAAANDDTSATAA